MFKLPKSPRQERGRARPGFGLVPVLLLVVVGGLALAGCGKSDTNADSMGALTPHLDIGTRGSWTGSYAEGVYHLKNPDEARALRTITLLRSEDPAFSIGVDIAFETETTGFAGIVFSHHQAQSKYFLLSLRPNGRIVLYDRNGRSLQTVFDTSVELNEGFNRLSFSGEGNSVVISINGRQVGTHAAQQLGEGGAGIAVLGIGEFAFRNFEASGYYRPPPQTDTPEGAS